MTRPNVLYITVDSLRADHVGFEGYDRETTPTLDRLAERGTTFHRAYAAGIPTYFSFKSLLAGVPSLGHTRDIGVPASATTLAEAFAAAGYETAGFNAGNPWLTREYGYHRGFQEFRDFLTDEVATDTADRRLTSIVRRFQPLAESNPVLEDVLGLAARMTFALTDRTPLENAETVTDAALEWYDDRADSDRPFFLWIHYMDPHFPWVPRDTDLEQFRDDSVSRLAVGSLWHTVAHRYRDASNSGSLPPDVLSTIRDLYDAEVRRTDTAVDRVLDAVEAAGDLQDTLVTVVGDHGTELQDHGGFSHGPRSLYEEVTRVPLVLAGPSIPQRETTGVASLEDLPATVLERTGVGAPLSEPFASSSSFESDRSSAVTEVVYDVEPATGVNADNGVLVSCVDWPWKLVANRERETTALYHLDDDPDERTDRSAENPAVVCRLSGTLETYRERVERTNRTIAERERIGRRVDALREREVI